LRLAVISDIHGNSAALDAVLADIRAVGCDAVVNLGDVASGPMDPAGVLDRLMAESFLTVRGNHDRWLFEGPPPNTSDVVDRFTAASLNDRQAEWLRALPATAELDGSVLLCHGTPNSDTTGWLDGWFRARNTTLPDEATVTAHAAGFDHDVFLCGHTHLARAVRLRDDRLIVNPGSVGLQFVHGSPDARYAMVERHGGAWRAALRAVPYDRHTAVLQSTGNGFGHWKEALATGWADPDGLF
jgi:putative phosphoesterase